MRVTNTVILLSTENAGAKKDYILVAMVYNASNSDSMSQTKNTVSCSFHMLQQPQQFNHHIFFTLVYKTEWTVHCVTLTWRVKANSLLSLVGNVGKCRKSYRALREHKIKARSLIYNDDSLFNCTITDL